MSIPAIPILVNTYIRKTEKNSLVKLVQIHVCNLPNTVFADLGLFSNSVYINTRTLKHVYDKRTAEEFDFLIDTVHLILSQPDSIYKNKTGARGEYCFVKVMRNDKYLCSLQIAKNSTNSNRNEIVTFFRTGDSYLKNYKLLWEWKDGNLHRNAFDAGFTQSTSTPQ